MNRRDFAKLLGTLACTGGLGTSNSIGALVKPVPAPPATPARPNFLFIAIDDLNDYVGHMAEESGNFLSEIYPDASVRQSVAKRLTPNLDALAARSTRFLRHNCPGPVCCVSRTALLTGVAPHRTGIYSNNQCFRNFAGVDQLVTLPQYLKLHGYYTAGAGKIFHKPTPDPGKDWPDAKFSWSEWVNCRVGAEGRGELSVYSPPGGGRLHLFQFGPLDVATGETHDYRNAEFIGTVLKQGSAHIVDYHGNERTLTLPANKPFLLACGLFRPHLPWRAPREFFARFPVDEMAITESTLHQIVDDLKDLPPAGLEHTDWRRGYFKELLDSAKDRNVPGGQIAAWRHAVQAYLACISYMDTCLGRLLDGLAHSPHAANTVTVLWSDHGWHLGGKYHFAKFTLWEESARCNLLIHDPRSGQPPGGACRAPTSHLDIYPTLANMAGLPVPAELDGRDISPLLEKPDRSWDEVALLTHQEGNHTVRSTDWRYIRYRNGDEELYHDAIDPMEQTNLAHDPAHGTQKEGLRREMDHLLHRYPVVRRTT